MAGVFDDLLVQSRTITKNLRPDRNYDDIIELYSTNFGVDSDLVKSVVRQESGSNPLLESPANAQGLMQIIPATQKELGVENPFDPDENVRGGVKYLKQQIDDFGDVDKALAAYNWGPGNVRKAVRKFKDKWKEHLPEETENYLKSINSMLTEKGKSIETPKVDVSKAQELLSSLSFKLEEEPETLEIKPEIPAVDTTKAQSLLDSLSFKVPAPEEQLKQEVQTEVPGAVPPTKPPSGEEGGRPEMIVAGPGAIPAVAAKEIGKGFVGGAIKEGVKRFVRGWSNLARGISISAETVGKKDKERFLNKIEEIEGKITTEKDPDKIRQLEVELEISQKVLGAIEEDREFFKKVDKASRKVLDAVKVSPEFKQEKGVKGWVQSAIMVGAQLPAAAAAGVAAGPLGAAATMGGYIAGSTIEELEAKGVETERATIAGVANALAQAPLEAFGIGKMLKAWKPGQTGRQIIKSITESGLAEGFTEFLQTGPDAVAKIWAQTEGKPNSERIEMLMDDSWNIFKQAVYEGSIGLAVGGVVGGAGAIATTKPSPPAEQVEMFPKKKEPTPAEQKQELFNILKSDLVKEGVAEEEASAKIERELKKMSPDLQKRVTKIIKIQEQRAEKDLLTGVGTRRFGESKGLFTTKTEVSEGRKKTTLIFPDKRVKDYKGALAIDLDEFKKANDKYGHSVGDDILIDTGSRLRENFEGKGDIVRTGGDEFVIFVRNKTNKKDILEAQRILRKQLAEGEYAKGKLKGINFTGGYAEIKDGSIKKIFEQADAQLLAAKKAGRGITFEGGKKHVIEAPKRDKKGIVGRGEKEKGPSIIEKGKIFETAEEKVASLPADQINRLPSEAVQGQQAFDPIKQAEKNLDVKFPKSLQDKLGGRKKPIADHKVIEQIAQLAKVPIRIGRFRQKAKGIFKTNARVVRIKAAEDVYTSLHEAGHAMQENLMAGYKLSSKEKAELVALGKELYGAKRPVGGYASEGFAEFFAQFVTKGAGIEKAPVFAKFFEQQLNKPENARFKKQFDKVAEAVSRSAEQGSFKRVASKIEYTGRVRQRVASWIKDTFSVKRIIDELDPFKKYDDAVRESVGRKLLPSETTFQSSSALKYAHESKVRYMVNEGMLDLAGNVVGPPLSNATALIKNKRKEFTAYLFARRALERWSKKKNPGISKTDAEFVFNELDSKEFRLAADRVYAWNKSILNYLLQADPTMAPVVDKILAGSVDYVPLGRVFDEIDSQSFKLYTSKSVGGNPLKMFMGSGRRIRDPFQVMIENAGKIVRQAHQRIIINNLVRWTDLPGMGVKIEKVPADMLPQNVQLDQIRNKLEKMGADLTETETDQLLTFFTPAQEYKGRDPIVPVYTKVPVFDSEGNPVVDKNGIPKVRNKMEWYWLDRDLYDALNSVELYRFPKVFDLLFAAPARMFKLGTTGLRASFSLVRNPMRDLPAFLMQTKSNKWTLNLVQMWVRQNLSILASFLPKTKKNPYLDLFNRLGANMSQPLGQDVRQVRRAAKELFKGKVMRVVSNPIDFLRDFLQIPEAATRTAEIRALTDEIGWKPGEPITFDQALQLSFNSKRVTTDFGAAGDLTKKINQTVPFFGPAIQGARTFARTVKERPVAASLKAISWITLPTLFLWWRNKDKEWYKDLPWWEKFSHWNIEVGDEIIRIPRPFEWGNVYSTLPEAIFDSWYRDDPEGLKEATEHVFETTLPTLWPQTVKPLAEQLANKNFFTDRPIVGIGDLKGPYEDQYGRYTSRLAVFLGKKVKWSPDRIDHLIRGYFGGLGTDVADVTGFAIPRKKNEFTLSDIPVVGTIFRRGGIHGKSQAVEDMFREYKKYRRLTLSKDEEVKYNDTNMMAFNELDNAVKTFKVYNDLIKADEFSKEEKINAIKEMKSVAIDALDRVKEIEKEEQRLAREIKK
jgi:diguanylate cyclase (GGDEF)-like protein